VLAPGGRLVAIESVFDVPFIDIPPDDLTKPGGKLYSRLNASRQFALNVFFDWFYNRVIHFNRDPACKVNVPCNFLPVSGWNREFQNVGLHRAGGEMSGFDIPIVPEFHAQLVAEKSDGILTRDFFSAYSCFVMFMSRLVTITTTTITTITSGGRYANRIHTHATTSQRVVFL
ncbi:hypothetical protein KBD59_02130, partial [Candidatus Gracilibacteria bacterium]|nr:hypothetical protein [Candidatus Gracilibacteria bacterium]